MIFLFQVKLTPYLLEPITGNTIDMHPTSEISKNFYLFLSHTNEKL